MIVVEGSFDPIREKELSALKQLHKVHRTMIFVQLKSDGVLPLAERMKLTQQACRPFRYLQLIAEYQGKKIDFAVYADEEKKIREGCFRLAAHGTRKMIFAHGWYFQETAEAMCNPHRYEHSLRTAETARIIAEKQGVDPDAAYQAGLIHDITKAMSHEEGAAILQTYRPDWLNYSDKIWHSYTAVIWMKQNMGFYDKKILDAVEHHTLGDGHAKLAQILYVADKIEPGRGYDTTKHLQMACTDLKACVQLVKNEGEAYRKNREGVHE
jgi:predicted HD superfamily hydrolase involved in NAD metabolism